MVNPKLTALLEGHRTFLAERPYPEVTTRRAQLRELAAAIESHSDDLLEALAADLGKCPIEAYTSEIGFVLRDIRYAVAKLAGWMKERRTRVPVFSWPAQARLLPEPLGTVLIIGPWNYPFQLLFSPLVSALAAGNAVCLKPSEFAPATAEVIRQLVRSHFPENQISVVLGNAESSAQLAAMPFDHIFFTGSIKTGRKVAAAAAKHPVPITLELGGKSPCIVCADTHLPKAARRILWGKSLNAGQTCVAPDYVWVEASIEQAFLKALRSAARQLVPQRPPNPDPGDYCRIINQPHFDRLTRLMAGAHCFDGGEMDRDRLLMAPAILTGIDWNHPIMQEEIFGPLLPVLTFQTLEEVLQRLVQFPKPLAAYLFSKSRSKQALFLQEVSAGGICINDTISQILPADLPFGGVGQSGFGRYRGRAGFDCFSNAKAIVRRKMNVELPFRYPPYKGGLASVKKALRWLF